MKKIFILSFLLLFIGSICLAQTPTNIRKNNITFYFNKYKGNIEEVIFDYSVVDEKGIEIERKKEGVIKYFNKEIEDTLLFGSHSVATKIEHFVNMALENIKKDLGIK